MTTIQFRRGAESDLPTLAEAEPGMAADTGKLYIGTAGGNREVAVAGPDGKVPEGLLPDDLISAVVQVTYNGGGAG